MNDKPKYISPMASNMARRQRELDAERRKFIATVFDRIAKKEMDLYDARLAIMDLFKDSMD